MLFISSNNWLIIHLITIIVRFKAAIELYNKLDPKQLGKIANTIVQRLNVKTGQPPFSDAELEQLKATFNIQNEELDIVIACCGYIWDQAAFYNLSSEALSTQLTQHHLDESIATIFAYIWKNNRSQFIQQLHSKPFGTPMILDDIHWKLQLTTSSQHLSKTKQLNTLMTLSLVNANDYDDEQKKDELQLEFTNEQLIEFFKQLETVQQQLDRISK